MADTELKVRISGDLTAIRNSLQGLQQQLVTLSDQANRAGTRAGKGLGQIEGFAGRAVTALKGLVAAYAGFEGVKAFIRVADQAATLNARLRLATKSQTEFNRAYAETFAIAQRTRTGLEDTVYLYARLERSTRDLGVNQETLLALTETINQAAQLSGGGPSAEAALFQLLQGLASGTLRGEELNSVLEQTPRLAQAIADGLGVPIGKLREVAKEGNLTGAAVARALLNSRDQIASEFQQLPRTVSGAFTQLGNSISRIIERLNNETGLTDALVAGIDAAVPVLEGLATFITGLVQQFKDAGDAVRSFWQAFAAESPAAESAVEAVGDASADLFDRFKAELQILPQSLRTVFTILLGEGQKLAARLGIVIAGLGGRFAATWASIQLGGSLLFAKIKEIAGEAVAFIGDQLAATQRKAADLAAAAGLTGLADRLRGVADGFDGIGSSADQARADAAAARAEYASTIQTIEATVADFQAGLVQVIANADEAIAGSLLDREEALARLKKGAEEAAAAAGEISIPDPTGQGTGAARAAVDQGALLRDAIERSLRELQRLYDAGEIGLRDYFRERERLQTAAIDVQLAQAEAELRAATNQEQQAAALTKIAILQRERADIGPATARDQAEAEKALAQELENVQARLAELQGDTAATRRLELEREREELLQRFRDDPGAQALVNRLFDVELARTRAQAIRDEASRLTSELRAIEESTSVQIEAGTIGQVEGERQIQDARARTIQQLEELRQKLLEVLATNPGDTEAAAALREIDTEIGRVRASTETLKNQARDLGVSALTNFFTDIATGAKSAKDAFKDLVVSFVQGLAKMAAEALAKRIIFSLFGGFGGGAGGGTGVGIFHSGGVVGRGGMKRMIPAGVASALFAGAPRFHDGGIAGLNPGEVPAILQTGERVLSRSETARYSAGDRPAPGYRIVNAFDPAFVPDQMDSAEGERVVLNIIGRNPGRIQQLLGS